MSCDLYIFHELLFLGANSRAVTSLAFSMDGVSLVSGSEDGTARLWDTASRQVLRTFTHNKGNFK